MKRRSLFVNALSAGILFTTLALYPSAFAAPLSTIFVRQGATGDCSSWADACDLQTALASAASGDEIWVAAGTYYPGVDQSATFQLISGVEIYGGFPAEGGDWDQRDWSANPTILSGDIGVPGIKSDNSYHVVTGSGTDTTAILDGFHITAGLGGGGMYNNQGSPTLTQLSIYENIASTYGAGIYNLNSSPVLTQVSFINNIANWGGGGMYNESSSPTLTNVEFHGNSAEKGGGMYNNFSSPTLTKVIFDNNRAFGGGGMWNSDSTSILEEVTFKGNIASWGDAGGLENWDNSNTILSHVVFSDNEAFEGGGIENQPSSRLTLNNVTFTGNTAINSGGGISNSGSITLTNVTFFNNSSEGYGGGISSWLGSISMTNVTFSSNTAVTFGGGMSIGGASPTLMNITMFGNTAAEGGGIYSDYGSSLTLVNSILWGNTAPQISGDPVAATYSDIQGGYDGTGDEIGNIDSDPLLEPLGDYGGFTDTHALGAGSPAIDSGSPSVCPPTDQRGVLRPVDGNEDGEVRCDMGAYEYTITAPDQYLIYIPLVIHQAAVWALRGDTID